MWLSGGIRARQYLKHMQCINHHPPPAINLVNQASYGCCLSSSSTLSLALSLSPPLSLSLSPSLSLSLSLSLSRKGFSRGGGSGRAPLLCIQALQEQRTDIRPKNTQPQPHQPHSGNHESIALFLRPSPALVGLHARRVFRKVCKGICVFVCVCLPCLCVRLCVCVTSCFSTTSHATCSPSKPLKGTSRVSISHST